MHRDFPLLLIDDRVTDGDVEILEGRPQGAEVGGVLGVVSRWLLEIGRADLLDAVRGAEVEDGGRGPGVEAGDDAVGGCEEGRARHFLIFVFGNCRL